MSFSYDAALTTPSDRVRFELADTDEDSAYLSDEEIGALLGLHGDDPIAAAQAAAAALAMRFGRLASVAIGDVRIDYASVAAAFGSLRDALLARITPAVVPVPFAGGISAGDKAARAGDGDAVRPAFTRRTGEPYGGVPERLGYGPW